MFAQTKIWACVLNTGFLVHYVSIVSEYQHTTFLVSVNTHVQTPHI